jgi:hypothetical protein
MKVMLPLFCMLGWVRRQIKCLSKGITASRGNLAIRFGPTVTQFLNRMATCSLAVGELGVASDLCGYVLSGEPHATSTGWLASYSDDHVGTPFSEVTSHVSSRHAPRVDVGMQCDACMQLSMKRSGAWPASDRHFMPKIAASVSTKERREKHERDAFE